MKVKLIIPLIVAMAVLGCKKGTQPLANPKECPNCDDLNARLAELEKENGQLRELAARRQAIFDELKRKLSQPIKASGWKSNWHLSSARAQSVLMVLLSAGVPPEQLAAAGFGEYDPDDDNDTEKGRALNRRTEIMVIPDLEQIFNALK